MKYCKSIIATLFILSSLNADDAIRTEISFNIDDSGNLNPNLFIPLYYGDTQQYFSAVGYASTSYKDTSDVIGFSDSKNAIVSSSKELLVNYISYKTTLFGFETSFGAESTFTQIDNNEFGYIHDSSNVFGNGNDYYIAFDNEIELDIHRHALRADISLPLGDFFSSRLSASISPLTSIEVKQSTIFKPLVNETGTSFSKTTQDIAYSFLYELQVKTGSFFDIGALVSYNLQPLKYDIAQLTKSATSYAFETNTIDTTELKSLYLVKLIFDVEILGGLNPSLGYGVQKLKTKDNISGKTSLNENALVHFGFQKSF